MLRSDMAAGRRVSGIAQPRLDLTQPKRFLRAPRGGCGCPSPLLSLLGSILDTLCPKLPAWMEALSFPTAEPKSFGPPRPPQGGQERGPPALPAGAGQLSSAFTPHLIQHQPVRLGLPAFPGRGGQEGAGRRVLGCVTDPVNSVPSLGSQAAAPSPLKPPGFSRLFPLREPRQMLKTRVPHSHCEP